MIKSISNAIVAVVTATILLPLALTGFVIGYLANQIVRGAQKGFKIADQP